jgi:ribonuclease P protein component
MKLRYGKEERLKRKKLIDQLFVEGTSVSCFPLRFVYLPKKHQGAVPLMVGVSVPKKNMPKAVQRNRVKRVLREAYRHNKQGFLKSLDTPHIGMFVYVGKPPFVSSAVPLTMEKIASKFSERLKKTT